MSVTHRNPRRLAPRNLPLKHLLIALIASQLVAACASSPQMTREERIEWYRANAGEPVRSFFYSGHLRGWTALDDRSIALWTRGNEAFLIEFVSRCPDLALPATITISHQIGRVNAGFDSVTVRRAGGGIGGMRCRIETIRPINTRGVEEAESDLKEAELVERDPSEPEAPR
jgi:hypothetical protein